MQKRGKMSLWVMPLIGMSQGLVLIMIMFLIYINDSPEEIRTYVKMCAYDAKIYLVKQNNKNGCIYRRIPG